MPSTHPHGPSSATPLLRAILLAALVLGILVAFVRLPALAKAQARQGQTAHGQSDHGPFVDSAILFALLILRTSCPIALLLFQVMHRFSSNETIRVERASGNGASGHAD